MLACFVSIRTMPTYPIIKTAHKYSCASVSRNLPRNFAAKSRAQSHNIHSSRSLANCAAAASASSSPRSNLNTKKGLDL